MDVASLGFRTDLMVRRLAGASVEAHRDHIVVRTPQNPTFYWGNFLLVSGPPQHTDAERWLESFADEFPAAGHIAIGVDGVTDDLGDAGALNAAGLSPDVSVVLTTDTLLPPTGSGPAADLRALHTDEDWEQAVQMRLAVDDDDRHEHRMFVERRQAELRALADAGHGVYVGAFVDGVVRAGLGLVADAGVARYQNVETHPDFRRRGFASALLRHAERLVRERHPVEQLVIVADPDDVAVGIYRRAGFRDRERQVQWQRA